jgi:hypothetical protein
MQGLGSLPQAARARVDGHVQRASKARRRMEKRTRRAQKQALALVKRAHGVKRRADDLRKRTRRRSALAHRAVYRRYNTRFRGTYAARLDRVPSRDELPEVLNRRGLVGEGAEIGVKLGKYSEWLLEHWHGARLISIDPWLEDAPENYLDRANVAQEEQDRFHRSTLERLARFGDRSVVWRATSVEAAARVPDGSLDFAYIDARHDHASVLEDLEAWVPKVRPGGIVAGHDYIDGAQVQGDFGDFAVKPAVDEFFAARGIPVHATQGREPAEMFPTWIVEVPAAGAQRTDAQAAASAR